MMIKTIDAHIAGTPIRLIVGGFPSPSGTTMADKREWARAEMDHVRCLVMREPRGHRDMTGAVLTEPADNASTAGVLFMDANGYREVSALGAMAVAALAIQHRLIVPSDGVSVTLDTLAGPVRASVTLTTEESGDVVLDSAPAFVLHGGMTVDCAGRTLRVDVVASGACYAVVDAESAGVPLDLDRVAEIRRVGVAITEAVNRAIKVVHPLTGATSVAGTVVTSPAHHDPALLRHVLVTADGTVGRAPSGSGSGAVLAVLDAMGILVEGQPITCEGMSGLTLSAEIAGRRQVGDYPAVNVRLRGRVFTTGGHAFVLSDDDPLRNGLSM
ncbi:MAG: proline racemase family protein [Acidobacteriaceae bacterium]|jgi:trans-L-3-hydroxyproline dehydratase|nr:proline racemase family protein [Acidobacteriaceae bacterium]